jgi:hypothetical protein
MSSEPRNVRAAANARSPDAMILHFLTLTEGAAA